jgi:hypothetical protein
MNTASAVFPNVAGGTTEDNLGGYRRTGEDIARERALNNKNPSSTGPRPPEGMVQGEGPTVEGLTRESFTFKRPPNITLDRGLGQQIGNKGGSWNLPTGTRGPGNPTGGTGRGGPNGTGRGGPSGTGRGGPSAPGRGNPSGGVSPEGPVPVEGLGVGGTLLGVLGLLSIAATLKSVLFDVTHKHVVRGLETGGIAAGLYAAATLAAKVAPKVFTPARLGVYGVAASAVLDVYKNPDSYATEGYNFAVSAFKTVGIDAADHPYAGTAAAIGYVVGASVTRAAIGAIQSLLEPSELIEGTAYDPYTAMMIGP